jgi:hypothetical protein
LTLLILSCQDDLLFLCCISYDTCNEMLAFLQAKFLARQWKMVKYPLRKSSGCKFGSVFSCRKTEDPHRKGRKIVGLLHTTTASLPHQPFSQMKFEFYLHHIYHIHNSMVAAAVEKKVIAVL